MLDFTLDSRHFVRVQSLGKFQVGDGETAIGIDCFFSSKVRPMQPLIFYDLCFVFWWLFFLVSTSAAAICDNTDTASTAPCELSQNTPRTVLLTF